MTPFVHADQLAPNAGFDDGSFDVRTTGCDATRAMLDLSGNLDDGAAVILAEVIDGHVRAGRRFLRMYVGGVGSIGTAAVEVIAGAHDRLLAAKGTMILTGVRSHTEAALKTAVAGSRLLLLGPTAAESGESVASPQAESATPG